MIPDMDMIRVEAEKVLASVPDGVLGGKTPAALYGLGFLGMWALQALPEMGVRLSACFDGNPALSGLLKNGVPVHSPDQLTHVSPDFVFITARHAVKPVSERLAASRIAHVSCDAFCLASDFPAFAAVHDGLLTDERSRAVMRCVLMAMLTGERSYLLDAYETDQYFCLPQFCGLEKETYVDAGAYVGDSLERFIWAQYGVFEKAYAFEPGGRQFAALKTRTTRLAAEWALADEQIELVAAALGEDSATATATSVNGQMTNLAIGDEGETIRVESLDTFLDGGKITFLKADVEGMELALLAGAEKTISKCKPKLAICVYHYPPDIPAISQYLKALVPEYRFALRHHSPQLMETVLYAWVDP
jgi:FkbM family methyltransferase